MGADIHGHIEIRPINEPSFDDWYAVVDAGMLLGRNYNAFGSLFGVRNYSGFVPIAPNRGLPINASQEVRERCALPEDADEDAWVICHSHSWLTWQEIQSIKWDEFAISAYVNRYRKTEGGEYLYAGGYIPEKSAEHIEGHSWFEGTTLCKVERITLRASLGKEFEMLFEIMRVLAKNYGDENVRLVVWFDN